MKAKFLENPEKNWQNYRGRHGNSLQKDLQDIGQLLEREKDRLKAMEDLGIVNPDQDYLDDFEDSPNEDISPEDDSISLNMTASIPKKEK